MLASLILSGWIAQAAIWTPLMAFKLQCTGTQTAYQETLGQKVTLPWQETFLVDLNGGRYCSQACSGSVPISLVRSDGLDLENSQGQYGSTLKRFHSATGVMETNSIIAASPTDRFHVEQAGTCKMAPLTTGQ